MSLYLNYRLIGRRGYIPRFRLWLYHKLGWVVPVHDDSLCVYASTVSLAGTLPGEGSQWLEVCVHRKWWVPGYFEEWVS